MTSGGGEHAQAGADVFAGGDGFAVEAAQAIDGLREGVENHPGNGQRRTTETAA